MFKIKENVDLKELESFGYDIFDFDYVANRPFEPSVCRILIKQINKKRNVRWLGIFIENRIIQLRECGVYYYIIKKRIRRKYIENLIQAGFVEKVGEQNGKIYRKSK